MAKLISSRGRVTTEAAKTQPHTHYRDSRANIELVKSLIIKANISHTLPLVCDQGMFGCRADQTVDITCSQAECATMTALMICYRNITRNQATGGEHSPYYRWTEDQIRDEAVKRFHGEQTRAAAPVMHYDTAGF